MNKMTIADDIIEFTFSGDPADPIKRHLTGLYSFDHAFETAKGEFGMPIGCGYEVFGFPSIGKSTFCYSLLAHLGNTLNTNVVLSDLEGFDAGHFKNIFQYNQYNGDVHLIHQGTDEEIVEQFEDVFLGRSDLEKEYGIGMLDSLAAISPLAERDSNLGEANFVRRAVIIGQFSRRLLPTVHPRTVGSENIYLLVNHYYKKVGGNKFEYHSPGGNIKGFLCGVQIHLGREKKFPDGSYLLRGTLHKNRYGFPRKSFQVFMKAGVGIHKGLTALYDAAELDKVKLGKTIKIGNESLGYMKTFRDKEWENDEIFQPFYDLLKDNTVLTKD
jgi:hypothetical protein